MHPVAVRIAQRISSALAGGVFGGLAAAGVAYGVAGVLVERHLGLDTVLWPGASWLVEVVLTCTFGGALVSMPIFKRSATLKGMVLGVIAGGLHFLGLIPPDLDTLVPPLAGDPGFDAALSFSAFVGWGVVSCWWMTLCGQR